MSIQPCWSGWLSETNVRTLFPQLVDPILDFSHETPTQEDTPMSVSYHEPEPANELENEPNNVHSQRVAPKGVLTEVTPPNFVSPQSAKYEGVDIHGLPSRMVRLKTAATKGGKKEVLVPLVIVKKNNTQPKMEETPLENAQDLSPSPQPGPSIMQRIEVPPQQELPLYDPSIMSVRVENPDKFSDVLVRVVEKHSGPIRARVSQVLPLYERQAEELCCDPRLLLVQFYSMEDMPSNMEQVQTKTTSASPVQASASQPIPAVPSHVKEAAPKCVRIRARRKDAKTPPFVLIENILLYMPNQSIPPETGTMQGETAYVVQESASNDLPPKLEQEQTKTTSASPVQASASQPIPAVPSHVEEAAPKSVRKRARQTEAVTPPLIIDLTETTPQASPVQAFESNDKSTEASPVKGLANQLGSLQDGPIQPSESNEQSTGASPLKGLASKLVSLKAGPINAVPSAASNVLPTEGRPKRAAALKAAQKRLEASKKRIIKPRPVPPVSPQVTPNPVRPSGSLIPSLILVRIEDTPDIMSQYNYAIPSTSRGITDHQTQDDIDEEDFQFIQQNWENQKTYQLSDERKRKRAELKRAAEEAMVSPLRLATSLHLRPAMSPGSSCAQIRPTTVQNRSRYHVDNSTAENYPVNSNVRGNSNEILLSQLEDFFESQNDVQIANQAGQSESDSD